MANKHHVIIKGNKEGLVFQLDDDCPFEDLLNELKYKMEKTHHNILTGPLVHVFVKLGQRKVTPEEKEAIRSILAEKGNLLIQSIETDEEAAKPVFPPHEPVKIIKTIVRSGQVLHSDNSIMLLGDVNPGGMITSAGSIYIMGSLRGMAHAGIEGDERVIIAASHLLPTQLRIAHIVSRPPDEWGMGESFMEFAYIRNGVMQIDKIQHLHRLFP